MVSESPESLSMNVAPSEEIAKFLLEIGAIKFNVSVPFIWTSGIKSPIYCDNRIINSKVEVRSIVVSKFSDIITKHFLSDTDVIAGVAIGGIPYGVLAADRLNLPFIYVREKRKEHGLKKQIEGEFKAGQRVVLIEDHISTGLSSLRAVEALRTEGLKLVSLISIMTYGFKKAEDDFRRYEIQHVSICDLDTILKVAQQTGKLNSSDVNEILKFRQDPDNWQKFV